MIDQDELHDGDRFQMPEHFPSGGLGLIFEKHRRGAGLERVALSSAVAEPRPDVAQIAALADRRTAKLTEFCLNRGPAIDQHESEFHVGASQIEAIDRLEC